MTNRQVAAAVTALFVPGDRPDRYHKAAASGADLVIIDLEDAVAPTGKEAARGAAVAALSAGRPAGSTAPLQALVRINDPSSAHGRADLVAAAALVEENGHGLLGVMIPKAGRVDDLDAVAAAVDGLPVVALIESAEGVAAARVVAAHPGVTRLAFGALDFALDVGSDVDALTGQLARVEVVLASRLAGLSAPLESPSTSLGDDAAVETTSRAARQLGFGGRLCIHPQQLARVRRGFAPSEDEVSWARRIADTGDAAARVDGQMVDRPVLERAREILRRAEAAE